MCSFLGHPVYIGRDQINADALPGRTKRCWQLLPFGVEWISDVSQRRQVDHVRFSSHGYSIDGILFHGRRPVSALDTRRTSGQSNWAKVALNLPANRIGTKFLGTLEDSASCVTSIHSAVLHRIPTAPWAVRRSTFHLSQTGRLYSRCHTRLRLSVPKEFILELPGGCTGIMSRAQRVFPSTGNMMMSDTRLHSETCCRVAEYVDPHMTYCHSQCLIPSMVWTSGS